jgi:methyltransferase, FkbM family
MFILKWLVALVRPFVNRFPRVAAIYRGVRDQMEALKKPVVTPWGFKLAGNPAMAQGAFEPLETDLIRKLLKDVDVLVNVGANVGYYCCHALSMGKSVIAFEPIPRNLRYLYQNIKANEWSGAEIYPIALSNNVGVLEIYGGDTGASILKGWAGTPETYVTLVPSSTMDVVLGKKLRGKRVLVLVDVEGAEYWMLEGATKMLASDPKPVWLVEITTNEHQPAGVEINPNFKSTFQFFFQNGYQAFNVDQDLHPVTMEKVDLASKGSFKFKAHNFLFTERL